jgi:intermediate peptidase
MIPCISTRRHLLVQLGRHSWLPLVERFTKLRPITSLSGSDDTGATSQGTGDGFAGITGLRDPRDWKMLASKTEGACRGLVDSVIKAGPKGVDTIRTLDEISDILCQTIDAAEFCRHVHEDPQWRHAANAACDQLGAFVHELNTHYGLYTALCGALDSERADPKVDCDPHGHPTSRVKDKKEYMYVGEMLRRDFERYGVHLEGGQRDEMTQLVADIHRAGHEYMTNAIDESKTGRVIVNIDSLLGRKQGISAEKVPENLSGGVFSRRGNSLVASGCSKVCLGLLVHSDIEDVRKAAFQTYHSFPVENAVLVQRILSSRHRVAEIMGFDSFAAYQLDGFSLSNTPLAVEKFLKGINESIVHTVVREREVLEAFKNKMSDSVGTFRPWDREWSVSRSLPDIYARSFGRLNSLFRVSEFLPGMSALLEEAMGLSLTVVDLHPTETWAPGVVKVWVQDTASKETFGTIYMDLLQRPGKFGGAALFTLRCGRRVAGGYQSPKVALVANISSEHFLSFGDLETLCHEFGHALHSVLSRTEMQHLSGTRGPQDIIEVPSHVFERFASDQRALKVMAKSSGCDPDLLTKDLFDALSARRRHFAATKLQRTVQLCLMDQYMHSNCIESSTFGSQADIDVFMKEHGLSHPNALDEVRHPPLRFTHLVGYAGNYYSYLFANCIAAEVWESNGGHWPSRDVIHDKMMGKGGSLPAREYIEGLVGQSRLEKVTGSKRSGNYPKFYPYLKTLGLAA